VSKITLQTLRSGALAYDETPPSRMVVLPWGRNATRRGDFVVDALTAKVFAENQNRNRFDGKVALDFEHNTLEGTPAYKSSSEPRPVAAWALCRVIEGEGLVYEEIEWTPDGLSAWQRRLYQDISPAPVRGADGKTVIALHSAALCRHGELVDFTIAHAAAPKALAAYFDALSADSASLLNAPDPTTLMKEKLISLCSALGVALSAEADESATGTALDSAIAAVGKLKAKPEPMSAEVTAELNTLRTQIEAGKKDLLLMKATQEGKVIPLSAEAIAATPLSAIEELVKAAKSGEVNLTKKTAEGAPEAKAEPLSAEAIEVFRSCGLTEAEIEAKKAERQKAAQKA